MAPAPIVDLQAYRSRRALLRCGTGSSARRFLWLDPASGMAAVGVFRPAAPTAAESLRRHDRPAG